MMFLRACVDSLYRLVEAAQRDGIDRITVGAIISRSTPNGVAILLLRRSASDFLGGMDEVPGGGVESGEALAEALAREVLEESGLIVVETRAVLFAFDYKSRDGLPTRQFNLSVRTLGDDVRLNPCEHQDFRWVTRANLVNTRCSPELEVGLARTWPLFRREYE